MTIRSHLEKLYLLGRRSRTEIISSNESIDSCLTSIADEIEKMEKECETKDNCEYGEIGKECHICVRNQAITDIARLFRGKTSTQQPKGGGG